MVQATGLANLPIMKTKLIPGMQTGFSEFKGDIDPEVVAKSMVVFAGSVLGEHPDYVVRTMGAFLGLYSTINFGGAGCDRDADYCADTFTRDFSKELGPNGVAFACDCTPYFENNHMASGRRYTCFTYDQRERIRAVLKDAYFRP